METITTAAMAEAEKLEPVEKITAPFAELLPTLQDAAQARRRLGAALIQEAEGFETMIRGYQKALGLAPEIETAQPITPRKSATIEPATDADAEPRGMEAVRRIMREGGVWTPKEIHAELEKRGWVSPDAKHPIRATEAAINRLWRDKGEIEKVGRARYRFKTAPTDQATMSDSPGGDDR